MTEYKDFPLEELARDAELLIECGATVYFKWTCEKCGERVTAVTPNQATTFSHHDETYCGHITDTGKKGGNILAIHTADSLAAYTAARKQLEKAN